MFEMASCSSNPGGDVLKPTEILDKGDSALVHLQAAAATTHSDGGAGGGIDAFYALICNATMKFSGEREERKRGFLNKIKYRLQRTDKQLQQSQVGVYFLNGVHDRILWETMILPGFRPVQDRRPVQ